MSIKLTNSSSYAYIEFDGTEGDYDYKLTLVAPYHSRAGTPNTVRDSSMGSDWEFIASINGGFFWLNGDHYEANGIERQHYTWNEVDDSEYDDVLAVGGSGDDNTQLTFSSQSNMKSYTGAWAITGGISLSGGSSISSAVNTSTGHSFIGKSGSKIIMGVSKSGVYGSTLRSYISGLGYTGVELDGGGSTSFVYNGTQYSNKYDGRQVKNVICLYRKKKSSPTPTPTTQYTITTNASPTNGGSVSGGGTFDSGTTITLTATANSDYEFSSWSNGETTSSISVTVSADATYTAYFTKKVVTVTDDRRLGTYAVGLTYVYKGGSLKKANPWYRLKSGALQGRPEGIYQLQNGALKPLILKNYVNYNSNGGSYISSSNFYSLLESITSLPTPTHSDYDSRAVSFDGWFYDNTFATKVVGVSTNAAGNRTYYAKWKQTKTQYSGYYITGGSITQSILSDSYTGGWKSLSNQKVMWLDTNWIKFEADTTVTKLYVNIDYYLTGYTNYKKPAVYYGYYNGSISESNFVQNGQLYSEGTEYPGEVSVNYTIPGGSYLAVKSLITDGVSRDSAYLNEGSVTTSSSTSKYADWQDSSNPPDGSWASGYPVTRTVSRYYNGSSWSEWQ